MTAPISAALVFFGTTGGQAEPIVRMAGAGCTRIRMRRPARESWGQNGGVGADAFAWLLAKLRYVDGALPLRG